MTDQQWRDFFATEWGSAVGRTCLIGSYLLPIIALISLIVALLFITEPK